MADISFNVAKGRLRTYADLTGSNDEWGLILLQDTGLESDTVLADHDTVAEILASTNTEATFTGYDYVALSGVLATVEDANDRLVISANSPITYTNAGGSTDNSIAKAVVVYNPDNTVARDDSQLVPLFAFDCVFTTDGTTQEIAFNAAGIARVE